MRLKSKLDSVHFEILVILTQDRCTVCAKLTIGSEIVIDTPGGIPILQGSSALLDSVRLEIVLSLTQDSARFAPNVPQDQKSFLTHQMEL
jgi:hypothetical protein